MRKCVLVTGFLLVLALPALGQDIPRVEVFGGVSYARADITDIRRIDMKGWHASVAENANRWFGAVVDLSGHYRSPRNVIFVGDTDHTTIYSYLFGPRFSFRKIQRVTPFVQAMVGAAHITISPEVGKVLFPNLTSTALAGAVGGGVDVAVHRNIAIRVFQADYVATRFREIRRNLATGEIGFIGRHRAQNNLRVSAGIVLHLGRR